MTTLHNRPDMVPRFAGFPLSNADKKKRQVAEKHVGLDAFVLAMIERPELKCRLQRPEGSFYFHELFVAQGGILRGERVVGGREQILPVERLFLLDLGLINPELPGFRLPDEPSHRPMREKSTDSLFMRWTFRISQRLDRLFDPPERLIPSGLIFFGLLGIKY